MSFSGAVRPLSQTSLKLNRVLPKASIHSSAIVASRLRQNIKLRPPIPPTVRNIEVKDDHPLWQFFSEKKFVRASEDLEQAGKLFGEK